MKFYNRLICFTKRILTQKLYIVMLISILLLTAVYICLPSAKRSTDIKVSIYSEESKANTDLLINMLRDKNSLYNFYLTSDIDNMIHDVKTGDSECGYYIPTDFFKNYTDGCYDTYITQYVTPSTTLGSAINETLFCTIYTICAADLLINSVDMPEYNEELTNRLNFYIESDNIFRIQHTATGEVSYKDYVYRINLPVYEICLIFILFSSMLGLLIYQQDSEQNMYTALSHREQLSICFISIISAVIPMLFTGIIAVLIINSDIFRIISMIIFSMLYIILTLLLNFIIRKSTILTKVLPLIMLISLIIIFISTLL